ncbi:MAG: ATP-binding cassette domain-containing protein [Firmicutes bacterium]|nr:ATP-binding cassette domain-containing protein [Bacillota bacterium]HXL04365.1 ATP-binding cassette domain-containing protein [Bacillota bacterium]
MSKIEFSNVTKTRSIDGKTYNVLDDVSVAIEEGTILAIGGPSGAGKSTMLRLVNRLESVTSGSVLLDGVDVSTIDPIELRRKVGMVFQLPSLFPLTVQENLMYGPRLRGLEPSSLEAKVREMLDMVDLPDISPERPAGELSVGQQQRVAIARTLMNEPEVLLMDEPTSALDPTTSKSILKLVCDIKSKYGITVLFVSHSLEHSRLVGDRFLLIVDGRVIEESDIEAFFQGPSTELGRKFLAGELK